VTQPDERRANRTASVLELEWYDRQGIVQHLVQTNMGFRKPFD